MVKRPMPGSLIEAMVQMGAKVDKGDKPLGIYSPNTISPCTASGRSEKLRRWCGVMPN